MALTSTSFKKGHKHSDETRRKISLHYNPASSWNKGRKGTYRHSKEQREKWSKMRKGIKLTAKTIEKLVRAHTGKKLTEETKRKISVAKKGEPAHWEQGEKHWNWRGGITPENHRARTSLESRLWREAVFTRDEWTCQKYGIRGGKLHAHHIQNFADFPELRTSIGNGVTLSDKAHREFHKKYGIQKNTQEQMKEFLGRP